MYIGPRRVWARVGAPWRTVNVVGDMKDGITTCITINANGDVVPTLYLKKVKQFVVYKS